MKSPNLLGPWALQNSFVGQVSLIPFHLKVLGFESSL